jgi:putative ABC transport system substrate-binding protein
LPGTREDTEFETWTGAFLQGLAAAGWNIGSNVRIDTRHAGSSTADVRKYAAELVALAPDVVLAHGASTVVALLQVTQNLPIVFVNVADPVGGGFVQSLAQPGGNATGFASFEYSVSGKWPELLKQIAPAMTRMAVLRDPATPSGSAQFGVIQAVASPLRLEVSPIDVRDANEIERAVGTFARSDTGGLIVAASGGALVHRDLITSLASRYKLPAISFDRSFVRAGGLISYGPDHLDQYRRAVAYVDRILRGEKPADLPVQTPTKYELILNLKTAKALGIIVPLPLSGRADEVIE